MSNEVAMAKYLELQNGSDIRGVALSGYDRPQNLSIREVSSIARAFTAFLSKSLNLPVKDLTIYVGRDSRISGEELLEAVVLAIREEGAKAFDTGLSSTPSMFMSTVFPEVMASGSIMITASHLPMERNGMKFFTLKGGLGKKDIKELLEEASLLHDKPLPEKSEIPFFNLMELYERHLRNMITGEIGSGDKPLHGLKITVDAGNGAAGFYALNVLKPLGADISSSIYLEPDGTFPNHPANPEDQKALMDVKRAVIKEGTDLGLIFDTDVDRVGAIDSSGIEISRNRMVALASLFAFEKSHNTTIVTDSITSNELTSFIQDCLGLNHHRFKRGYKNVIDEAIRLNNEGIDSFLAIETSGHSAFKDNYFLDDGAYLATLIVIKAAALKREGKTIASLIEALKEPLEEKEVRIDIESKAFKSVGDKVLTQLVDYIEGLNNPLITIVRPNYEGVRVSFGKGEGDGWFLLRKSLHDPVLPLNIASNEKGGVEKIFSLLTPFLSEFKELIC